MYAFTSLKTADLNDTTNKIHFFGIASLEMKNSFQILQRLFRTFHLLIIPGGLSGGGIAGITLGVILAISFTVLIVIYSRRAHCKTFHTSRSSLRFDNALYGLTEEEARVQ